MSPTSAVPRARLTVPSRPALDRPRLRRRLGEVLTTRLGLVIAPPGHGTTTLLAQWARAVPLQACWYRVGEDDGSVTGLLSRLAVALDAPEAAPGVEGLALAAQQRNRPLLLVLDDAQHLVGTPAERALERLLLLAPPNLHLLLGGHAAPALDLARTELPAPIEVTDEDLRFTPLEVLELCRELHSLPVRYDEAALLARRTEGWAAALALALARAARTGPSRRRAALLQESASAASADPYIRRRFLEGLPSEQHHLAAQCSVLESPTEVRCRQLLGPADVAGLLAELRRRQVLLPQDAAGSALRFHPLVRAHLEAELVRTSDAGAVRRLRDRASVVLHETGAVEEAARVRARAGDWEGVCRLVSRAGVRSEPGVPERLTELLPPEVLDREPWLALLEARALLHDGQVMEARQAACRLLAGPIESPVRDQARDLHRLTESLGLGAASISTTATWEGALRAALRRSPREAARAAGALPGGSGRVVESLSLALAGDVVAAQQVASACSYDEGDRVAPYARLLLAVLERLQEPPFQAESREGSAGWQSVESVAAEAEDAGSTWLARAAHALSQGDAGRGDGLAELDRRGDAWGALLVVAVRALTALHDGSRDPAALEELLVRARELDAGVLEVWARAGLAWLSAVEGLPEAEVDVRVAEASARNAEVPGALALSYASLALTGGGDARTELLALAEMTARAAGLPCRARADAPGGADELRRPGTWPTSPDAKPTPRLPLTGPVGQPLPVHVQCFGRFSLRLGDEEVDLARVRPKARAALRLLAAHPGRTVACETVLEALWPGQGTSGARHNLHVAVSTLRALLEPGAARGAARLLVRDGAGYRLELSGDSTVDLLTFENALDQAHRCRRRDDAQEARLQLRRALAAYRGDLLVEDEIGDWVLVPRDHYRALAAGAAAGLAELEFLSGSPADAVVSARRALELDEYRDGSWRLLIEAYQELGDVAAAAQARRSYSEVLESLGLPPARPMSPPAEAVARAVTAGTRGVHRTRTSRSPRTGMPSSGG